VYFRLTVNRAARGHRVGMGGARTVGRVQLLELAGLQLGGGILDF
jgi:hypothetical protein